jgi:hypothetical protein
MRCVEYYSLVKLAERTHSATAASKHAAKSGVRCEVRRVIIMHVDL